MGNFTEKQIKFLKNHKSIEKVTAKHVTFSYKFKVSAVKKYFKGIPSIEIFRNEGFPSDLFSNKFITNSVLRWRRKFEAEGESGLELSKRGRKPAAKASSEGLDYDQLLAKVEYLEHKVDFLKKLKALKGK